MDPLQVGDWVRTPSGHVGKIVLLQRLSAFIDYGNESDSGPASCLLSELTKIDPPNPGNVSALSQQQ
jgi:hypothetical protein